MALAASIYEYYAPEGPVLLADADLGLAARAAATGRFANAGQACTAAKRLIVEAPVWDDFLEAFLARAREWTIGDPRDETTRLGPMSSLAARATLAAQVQDAVGKGATVHLGGAGPDGPGAFYPATVLSGVDAAMRAYHEELFGPVAVLYRASSAEEAVRIANDSPYGLGGAVFGGDESRAAHVADRLDTGMVGGRHHYQERTGSAVRRREELRLRPGTRQVRPRRVRQRETAAQTVEPEMVT